MKEVFNFRKKVKSYSQTTYWLNGSKSNPVIGKERKSSYHFPHGTREYDSRGNTVIENYFTFDGTHINYEFVFNDENEIIERRSFGKLTSSKEFNDDGKCISSTTSSPLIGKTDIFNSYDTLGNLSKSVKKDNDGLVTEEIEYCYDSNGIKTEIKISKRINNAPLSLQHHFTYNKRGDTTAVVFPTQRTADYIYDSFGNIISIIWKDKNGLPYDITSKTYTDDGLYLLKSTRHKNNVLTFSITNTYNKANNLINEKRYCLNPYSQTETNFNDNGDEEIKLSISSKGLKTKIEYEYLYDYHNNVIEMKRFIDGEPNFILIRELIYF